MHPQEQVVWYVAQLFKLSMLSFNFSFQYFWQNIYDIFIQFALRVKLIMTVNLNKVPNKNWEKKIVSIYKTDTWIKW